LEDIPLADSCRRNLGGLLHLVVFWGWERWRRDCSPDAKLGDSKLVRDKLGNLTRGWLLKR